MRKYLCSMFGASVVRDDLKLIIATLEHMSLSVPLSVPLRMPLAMLRAFRVTAIECKYIEVNILSTNPQTKVISI